MSSNLLPLSFTFVQISVSGVSPHHSLSSWSYAENHEQASISQKLLTFINKWLPPLWAAPSPTLLHVHPSEFPVHGPLGAQLTGHPFARLPRVPGEWGAQTPAACHALSLHPVHFNPEALDEEK